MKFRMLFLALMAVAAVGVGATGSIAAGKQGNVAYEFRGELAAKYGASAEETTPDPKQAYASFARSQRGRPASWDRLPWS